MIGNQHADPFRFQVFDEGRTVHGELFGQPDNILVIDMVPCRTDKRDGKTFHREVCIIEFRILPAPEAELLQFF